MNRLGIRSFSIYGTSWFDHLLYRKLRKNPMSHKCFKFSGRKWNKAANVHTCTINKDKSVSKVWKWLKYHGKLYHFETTLSRKMEVTQKASKPIMLCIIRTSTTNDVFITLPTLLPAKNWHLRKFGFSWVIGKIFLRWLVAIVKIFRFFARMELISSTCFIKPFKGPQWLMRSAPLPWKVRRFRTRSIILNHKTDQNAVNFWFFRWILRATAA